MRMETCKWLSDEFSAVCCNGDCPACGDGCPALNYYEICKYAEFKDSKTDSANAEYVKVEFTAKDASQIESAFCKWMSDDDSKCTNPKCQTHGWKCNVIRVPFLCRWYE